jgi:hypothetical protein
MAPAYRRGRYLVIDPAWLVAATLHAENGAEMTGMRADRVMPSRSSLWIWRRTPCVLLPQ